MKSKISEAQVVKVLLAVSVSRLVESVCTAHGVTEATYYVWMRQYAVMESDDIRRLRELEKENEALKLLVAERHLKISAVRKLGRKNGRALPGEPRERRCEGSQGVPHHRRFDGKPVPETASRVYRRQTDTFFATVSRQNPRETP